MIECFRADVSATQAGKLVKVNRNTANLWYGNFRERILAYQEHENGSFHGEVERNEFVQLLLRLGKFGFKVLGNREKIGSNPCGVSFCL